MERSSSTPVHYRVIQDYRSPYPDPIIFLQGEQVAVGREYKDDPEWAGWVWCRGENGQEAWVPKVYLQDRGEEGLFTTDYNAVELSVSVGEQLLVYEIVNGFGMAEKEDGSRGWVPMKCLEPAKGDSA